MLVRSLQQALRPRPFSICLQCCARGLALPLQTRFLSTTASLQKDAVDDALKAARKRRAAKLKTAAREISGKKKKKTEEETEETETTEEKPKAKTRAKTTAKAHSIQEEGKSLKEALIGNVSPTKPRKKKASKSANSSAAKMFETLPIQELTARYLELEPIEHAIPPIPMLSHGLDRVLFNPGVYRLQDPRSRIYNFDPYLEKIMPATEFDFDSLEEYQTSSKDETLLDINRRLGTKFTGSTSSMSSVLSQFHFLLSSFRELNHHQLSRGFPDPNKNFSKITKGPTAIFLRWKDGIYAIDADKSFDTPNILSWLGQSLEKLLTNTPNEFERFRKSNTEAAPMDDQSGRCFHYSRLGTFLMRSQLDAYDPRLPGTGVFDLKTRAVVSIRMDHENYEQGTGYQLRYSQGQWESYEREFYDMCRATMLKYSLQVRMGRMDGIFVAYHNIKRLFGFQYVSLPDMDKVLHGQADTTLGDQEFRMSVRLLEDLLQRATERFPETSIRLHFATHENNKNKSDSNIAWMSIFAEPVTEQEAENIQNAKSETYKIFERDHVGVRQDDPERQVEWHNIQEVIDEEVDRGDEGIVEEDREEEEVEKVDSDEIEGAVETDNLGEKESDEVDEKAVNQADDKEVEQAESENNEASPAPLNDEESDDATEETAGNSQDEEQKPAPTGPLMGWTLAVRHRVNGQYCQRPNNLTSSDDWTIEYVVKEMEADATRRNYENVQDTRRRLLAKSEEEVNKTLSRYREEISRWTNKGREWRQEQDKIDELIGQKIYRPMGPGSEPQDSTTKNV